MKARDAINLIAITLAVAAAIGCLILFGMQKRSPVGPEPDPGENTWSLKNR